MTDTVLTTGIEWAAGAAAVMAGASRTGGGSAVEACSVNMALVVGGIAGVVAFMLLVVFMAVMSSRPEE